MKTPWYEKAFGAHYPAIYAHRNEEEAVTVTNTLASVVPLRDARVLDVACGGGRHMLAMGKNGAHMFGLDLSMPLLRMIPRGELVTRGDMRSFPFRNAAFDGACNLFTSFGYFPTRPENESVLREVRRVLKPAGWFLFDFLNASRTLADLVARSERSLGKYRLNERRTYDETTGILTKSVVLADPDEHEPLEWEEELLLYSPDELRDAAARAGFSERAIWGDYDGSRFRARSSNRVILLLEPAP